MSTKVKISLIIVLVGLLAPLALAESYDGYYIAPASSIVDLNASKVAQIPETSAPTPVDNVNNDAANPDGVYHVLQNQTSATVAANCDQAPNSAPQNGGFLADVSTNVNVTANAQSPENQAVNQETISANVSVNKGPVYVQYSHTRTYMKNSDPYLAAANGEFQGTVNNQVTFGVSFSPAMASNVPANINTNTQNMGITVPVQNGVKTASVMGAAGN
jgi:hypothetical protein